MTEDSPEPPDARDVPSQQPSDRTARRDWLRRLMPAALLTCWLALYNGFPLCYFDTGAYLLQAQALTRGYLPALFDRPLTYGLFLAPFLKLASPAALFGVPLAQGLIIAFVVSLTLRVAGPWPSTGRFIALFGGISAFTSLPWFSGELMPDIFTSVVILLGFVNLWGSEALTRREQWAAGALLTLAIAAHLSHFPLYAVLLIVCLAVKARAEGTPLAGRRLALLTVRGGAPLLAALAFVMLPNWYLYGQPVLNRGTALFMLAHLVGDGAAQRYLDRACLSRHYVLCSDRASLRADSDWFLWSATGPWQRYRVYGEPGYSTFLGEAPAIVSGTLREEWPSEIWASVRNATAQLVTFATSRSLRDPRNEFVVARELRRVLPAALPAFEGSRQVQQALPLRVAGVVQRVGVGISVLVLLACVPLLRGRAHRRLRPLIITVSAGVLTNALVIGTLGSVLNRYQSRVVWLLPLVAIVAVLHISEAGAAEG